MRINSINYNINFSSRKKFKRVFKTCCYSGEPFKLGEKKTIEHIIPLSQGGKNEYSNYLIVKRDWNQKRSSIPLNEFIKQNPFVEDNIKATVKDKEGQIIEGIDWAEEVKKTLKSAIGYDIFKNS